MIVSAFSDGKLPFEVSGNRLDDVQYYKGT